MARFGLRAVWGLAKDVEVDPLLGVSAGSGYDFTPTQQPSPTGTMMLCNQVASAMYSLAMVGILERTMTETGHCPTAADLELLPAWACVAFAARCARRVVPLLTRLSVTCDADDVTDILEEIESIEAGCAGGGLDRDHSMGAADEWLPRRFGAFRPVIRSVCQAWRLASDLNQAPDPTERITRAEVSRDAAKAAKSSYRLAKLSQSLSGNSNTSMQSKESLVFLLCDAMHHDLKRLTDGAVEGRWDDRTPVSVEVCGPLWPKGAPSGWYWRDGKPDLERVINSDAWCNHCQYELRGLHVGGACPECGEAIAPSVLESPGLPPPRVFRIGVLVSLLLACAAVLLKVAEVRLASGPTFLGNLARVVASCSVVCVTLSASRWKRRRFPGRDGHWMLIMLLAFCVSILSVVLSLIG